MNVLNIFTGNTLNVWNYTGSAVRGVGNFEYYNFVLPASLPPELLTVTNTVDLAGSSVTGVSVIGGAEVVQPGSSKTLLFSSSGIIDNATHLIGTTVQGKHGATLRYDWTPDVDNNAFFANLNNVDAHPQAKSLSEGFLSGLALLRQGGDLFDRMLFAHRPACHNFRSCRHDYSIPENKLLGAINGYAKDVNVNTVLALHDSTFLGGGGAGYLISPGGIWISGDDEISLNLGYNANVSGHFASHSVKVGVEFRF